MESFPTPPVTPPVGREIVPGRAREILRSQKGAKPAATLAGMGHGVRRERAVDFGFWEVVADRPELWLRLGGPDWESMLDSLVSLVREQVREYDNSRAYGPPLNLSRAEIRGRIPQSREFLGSDFWDDEPPEAGTARAARNLRSDASGYGSTLVSDVDDFGRGWESFW